MFIQPQPIDGEDQPTPSSGSIAAGTQKPWDGGDGGRANPVMVMSTSSIYPIAKSLGENSYRRRNSAVKER